MRYVKTYTDKIQLMKIAKLFIRDATPGSHIFSRKRFRTQKTWWVVKGSYSRNLSNLLVSKFKKGIRFLCVENHFWA